MISPSPTLESSGSLPAFSTKEEWRAFMMQNQAEAMERRNMETVITEAELARITAPTTFEEIAKVLTSTIRQDEANKLILFCAGLLTFTEEDQINVLMSGETSGGKSYTALETMAYFPSSVVHETATASPTSFYHDEGIWDEERRLQIIDLRKKILVFLDQPHYMLLEKLRPLMSHDKKELLYKWTDRTKGGALTGKKAIILGFPTFVFCAAKMSLDEQDQNRCILLSPETNVQKLEESLQMSAARNCNRQTFKASLEKDPLRSWLKARVEQIQAANISNVVVPESDAVYTRFVKARKRLAPRHQRDLPRIISLIKANALLNLWHRERITEDTIQANQEDIEAGFMLYGKVAKANELGLAPQLYEIYTNVIQPLLSHDAGVPRKSILGKYYDVYGRTISDAKLRREILPALENSGLILEESDPSDKRRMLIHPPDTPIALDSNETIGETSSIIANTPDTSPISCEEKDENEPLLPEGATKLHSSSEDSKDTNMYAWKGGEKID